MLFEFNNILFGLNWGVEFLDMDKTHLCDMSRGVV